MDGLEPRVVVDENERVLEVSTLRRQKRSGDVGMNEPPSVGRLVSRSVVRVTCGTCFGAGVASIV
eukprot:6193915-Pleurochrysis_carterae.AAC.1